MLQAVNKFQREEKSRSYPQVDSCAAPSSPRLFFPCLPRLLTLPCFLSLPAYARLDDAVLMQVKLWRHHLDDMGLLTLPPPADEPGDDSTFLGGTPQKKHLTQPSSTKVLIVSRNRIARKHDLRGCC